MAGRRFLASTQRGIGPPRQSEPLNFELLLTLTLGVSAIVPSGPINTIAVVVLFTMFMLREVEGAVARRSHVKVDTRLRQIVWQLPVSKTDPHAHGCERAWGCTCPAEQHTYRGCPYCTMVEHLGILEERFGAPAQWLRSVRGCDGQTCGKVGGYDG